MTEPDERHRALLRVLVRHEVRSVLVGGVALQRPTPAQRGRMRLLVVAGARYARLVKPPVPNTAPTAEPPSLSDEERAKRLALLAERLRSPDGLDHDTLARIEQLTGDAQ